MPPFSIPLPRPAPTVAPPTPPTAAPGAEPKKAPTAAPIPPNHVPNFHLNVFYFIVAASLSCSPATADSIAVSSTACSICSKPSS